VVFKSSIDKSGGVSPVTSVTASSPLASSGGTTPNISLTGTVPASQVGAAGSDGQIQYNNGGVLGATADAFYNDTTGQTALGTTTFIGDERLRVLARTLYINDAADAGASINYGQSSGIPTGGYTFTYRVYGYKAIDGTTYYSATYSESTPVTDDSRTLSAPTPTGFTGYQNFSGSGYTDSTNVWDFLIVPYYDYPYGRATGTSQLVTITEGNTGNPYQIDFTWDDVSATGYYILRQQNGGGYTAYVDMGNVFYFPDQNNFWNGGTISYPVEVPDYYNLTVSWTDPGDLDGFIVLRQDNYYGYNYNYNYYWDVGLSTSLVDDNSGWTSPVPNVSVNSYLGPWLHATGDSTVIGDETRTGAVTMSGNVTAYNYSTDTANYRTSAGEAVTTSATYSTAIGSLSIASAIASTALGASSNATGDYSTAAGLNSNASGNQSTAIGYSSSAGTTGSTALGWSSNASGIFGTAIGYLSIASGTNSISIGTSSYSVYSSTAVGNGAYASGQGSTAIGGYASNGSGSTTGGQTTASALNTTAIGAGAQATASNAVSIGRGVTNSVASTVNIGTNASTYMTLNSSSLGSSGQMYYNASNVLAPTSQIAYVNSGTGITHLTLTSSQATNKGYVFKGAAAQTGNALEVQNSSGTGLAAFTAAGKLAVGITTPISTSFLNVYPGGTGYYAGPIAAIFGSTQAGTFTDNAGSTRTRATLTVGSNGSGSDGVLNVNSGGQDGIIFANAGGTVGISTVSPGAKLHVQGTVAATIGQIVQGAASQSASLTEWRNSSATVLSWVNSAGQGIYKYGATIGFGASNPGQQRLRLDQTDGTNQAAVIEFYNGGQYMYWFLEGSGASARGQIRTDSSRAIVLQDNATSSGGGVGVGQNTPAAKLHVQSGAAANKVAIFQGFTSQSANLTEWQDSGATVLTAIDSAGKFGTFAGFADGVNIAVGTSTGTKIGTATNQKLGFYNKTPIVQQANTAGAVSAGGLYTATEQAMLNDCYSVLRNLGLLS
jgi:hypothetical protein